MGSSPEGRVLSGRGLLRSGTFQTADAGSRCFLPDPYLGGRAVVGRWCAAFFVVCGPRFAAEARACLPEETDVTVSERQEDLMAFLNTPDPVLVLCRGGAACRAGRSWICLCGAGL